MNASRIWILGGSVVIAAILVLGWFVAISPALAQAASNDAERATVAAQNETYVAELATLKADYENLDGLRDELNTLSVQVPTFMNNPGILSAISDAAAGVGATVTDIQPEDPKLFEAATPNATTPVPAEQPAEGEAASTPAPSDPDADPTVPAEPVTTGPGGIVPISAPDTNLVTAGDFYTASITIKVNADLAQTLTMVKLLQDSKRIFLVKSVESAATGPSGPEGTITMLVYVHKDPIGVVLGQQNKAHGKPGDPATEPTPTPTPTETPTPEPTETPAP